MSKNKKYVPCGGLAFTEEKNMKKLSELAKEGWILDSFKYLGYILKKSDPQDVIYCTDYNDDKNDLESYFQMFEDSNWEHVYSYEMYHFFKAPTGTVPIYTDSNSESVKYKKVYGQIRKSAIYFVIMAVVAGIIAMILENTAQIQSIFVGLKIMAYATCGVSVGLTASFIVCGLVLNKKIINNKL